MFAIITAGRATNITTRACAYIIHQSKHTTEFKVVRLQLKTLLQMQCNSSYRPMVLANKVFFVHLMGVCYRDAPIV